MCVSVRVSLSISIITGFVFKSLNVIGTSCFIIDSHSTFYVFGHPALRNIGLHWYWTSTRAFKTSQTFMYLPRCYTSVLVRSVNLFPPKVPTVPVPSQTNENWLIMFLKYTFLTEDTTSLKAHTRITARVSVRLIGSSFVKYKMKTIHFVKNVYSVILSGLSTNKI